MKWMEFSVHTAQEAVEPISNILHESGASGVVIEDSNDLVREWNGAEDEIFELSQEDYPDDGVLVKAYFPLNSFLKETVEEVKQSINDLLQHNIDVGRNEVTLTEVHEEDWAQAWKKYYKPVKVSNFITIAPSWENYQAAADDELVIELDPGMAFGTGTHPSTVLCLQLLEKLIKGGEYVIDVGTGSGILAIAAAKLGAKKVEALDVDETAVESARSNSSYNHTEAAVTVRQNNLLENTKMKADVIAANILADIILRMVDEAYERLNTNGCFITSGIIASKKDEVKKALLQSGFAIVEEQMIDDWVALVAQKK
ncbi:ribosomal protein L11 methyltransferase [Alteribacillus persepolensis]|uniref:Ribosomal protein L11 methyltransferase n=1 Tax=Alteribacillus persepolensis TaxID=568899 RepID=A0A1G8CPJ8_9BACI|nr:50S ribosomal protein L11 methyltransferase [Alteribacillus persepolensis]SDH47385.1 ribosomal protein L11 methyltransferase [Alteribacillus persepolensis]